VRPERATPARVGVRTRAARAVVLAAIAIASGGAAGAAEPAPVATPVAAVAAPADTTLTFARDGKTVRTLDRAALERACPPRTVTIEDPYYEARKRFVGCPLRDVLALGFGPDLAALEAVDVFLRARDGYVKPATGARLLEPGGFLAWADADRPGGWEPIDRRQVDPGPYYLVWTGAEQRDPHRYPWPYQLVEIEIGSFAAAYPHTIPTTAPEGGPAWDGFAIFRTECVACHAINGEGGTIGPDLNVPQSIVEYRPRAQIKAYVRDPRTFRYTSMPSHPHLSDAQLDALLAYFDVMRGLKYDRSRVP
jgi:mono/diheme cytochrome c family protein